METVLGLGGSGHDWASCAIRGSAIRALAEERITRRKYGIGANLLAGKSRAAVLKAVGAAPEEVRHVAACSLVPRSFQHAYRDRIQIVNHHLAHAYSTFCASGYEDAAVLVADNAGSILSGDPRSGRCVVETISCFEGSREGLQRIAGTIGEHLLDSSNGADFHRFGGRTSNSLGYLYRVASLLVGFQFRPEGAADAISEDGKTMGLAPYGDDRFLERLAPLVRLSDGGSVEIPLEGFEQALGSCLGAETFEERASLAFAVQRLLEDALIHVANDLHRRTGASSLCIAGGVGLNSVANGRLGRETPFSRVFVCPAPGDDGIALGTAYLAAHQLAGVSMSMLPRLTSAYLGPTFGRDEIDRALDQAGLTAEAPLDLISRVAEILQGGAIIGWYQGGGEYGPRALGNRSILAAPFKSSVKDKINQSIKRREWFRPFAPVVPLEHADRYFEIPGEMPFMSFVARLRDPASLAAVSHVDGTARVQTLRREVNPRLHELLEQFGGLTGFPILLNTSFNSAGMPLVDSPGDAVSAARDMGLDALVLEDYLVRLK